AFAWSAASAQETGGDGEMERLLNEFRSNFEESELIEAPTRHLKPLGFTAEDVTVITAREIKAMNAHTVAEILNRIPGLFGNMFNFQFGGASFFSVHGAEPRSVLLMIDGIEINYLSEGAGETHWIPVQIIERIEIIRGPASAAWGSALSGVVNIVTKVPGGPESPRGFLGGSIGKNQTVDYRLEFSDRGRLDYYLFAGFKGTEGLFPGRSFNDLNLYSKLIFKPNGSSKITLSIGHSQPYTNLGDFEDHDFTYDLQEQVFWSALDFRTYLTSKLTLYLSARHLQQNIELDYDSLGLGIFGPPGSRYKDLILNEESTGISGKIVWKHPRNTLVLGADGDWGQLHQTVKAGETLQSIYWAPPTIRTNPDFDKWAVFINDTIILDEGKWSITPGMRYDRNSIDGSHFSYNLGLTFSPDKSTIFRASVGKGFGLPALAWSSGGGGFYSPNPDLDSEEVWSYQAGMESNALKNLRIKGSAFYHEVENVIKTEITNPDQQSPSKIYLNNGIIRRHGFELEVETAPLHGFSIYTGVAYVRFNPTDEYGASKNYSFDFALRYDNSEYFKAELFGHYINRDLDDNLDDSLDEKDDIIWDLNIS
ncbi:MAG: TonB-dependent receptor, partial [Deltaproteobacteria bacterium]|nr:TonB-dependent receptor [Deltaproteobacteria bacterium]